MAEKFLGCGHFIGNRVEARYVDSKDPMFRHNPFIEALPPVLSHSQLRDRIGRYPAFEESERNESVTYRGLAVERIGMLVTPLTPFFRFHDRFVGQLRSGYMKRNPLEAEWQAQLRSAYPMADFSDDPYAKPVLRSASTGSCVLGLSGTGKTTLVESVLGLVPQVIVHDSYNGTPFNWQQMVWIELQCPYNKTVKDLVLQFFSIIDEVQGSDLYSSCSRDNMTEIKLVNKMARYIRNVGLGALLLDEVQNLRLRNLPTKKRDEANPSFPPTLLRLLVYLSNTLGIPLILVGTPEVRSLLRQVMPVARRVTESGQIDIPRLKMDAQWEYFLRKLWHYQYVRHPAELSEGFSRSLYEASQGIINYCVRVFMFAQWEAIYSRTETLTPDLFASVAKEYLGPALDWLEILRQGKEKLLAEDPERALKNFTWGEFAEQKQGRGKAPAGAKGGAKQRRQHREDQAVLNYEALLMDGTIPKTDEGDEAGIF